MSNWKNRIITYGTKPASEFAANPQNPRRHPQAQRDAVKASLDTLGWVGVVIENKRTGLLIDGHERVEQALKRNEEVPYILVDLSEEEEAQALASLDWITQMATYDSESLDRLIAAVNTDNNAISALLADIASKNAYVLPEATAQAAPTLQYDCLVEIHCSAEDLKDFEVYLNEWNGRETVSINIS